ncbi:hypothetical protein [Neobacillus niacini]|uniref:hypothetical protein n=1 Tax=Neobacillus niacini TaxID=86668 RepID=UPI003983D407
MKMKIAVSLSIFSILLACSWFLQLKLQNHRTSEVTNTQSHINNMNAVPMNNDYNVINANRNTGLPDLQWNFFEPFKPREYVRIINTN